MDMNLVLVTMGLVIGFGAAYATWRWPAFFWQFIIGAAVLAAGVMIAGHAIVDEYLMGFILLGGILAIYTGRVPARSFRKRSFHEWLFLAAVLYFALESIRGSFVLHDPRMMRWILYYSMFGVLFIMAERWEFPQPSVRQTAVILGIVSVLYFAAYLALGFFDECVLGIARWGRQGVSWAGSSYALAVLTVSFPAAYYLLGGRYALQSRRERILGWLTLAASITAIGYYDSRVGWLALFGFLFLTPVFFGLRRGLGVAAGILGISGLVFLGSQSVLATPHCRVIARGEESFMETSERLFDGGRYAQRATDFVEGIAATTVTPLVPRVSDMDRILHLKAGFHAMTETPARFLFGGGIYTHKYILYPYIKELFTEHLPGVEVSQRVYTMGFPALAVDVGIVGLALLMGNLFLSMRACISPWSVGGFRASSVLLGVLLLIPFWFAVSNIQDAVLIFLLIMPQGPLAFLAAREPLSRTNVL